MDLKDSVVAIAGAGRGIGRALALEFARRGARLSLCARSEAALGAVRREAAQVLADGERSILTMALDISNRTQSSIWMAETARRFGRLDILVNNASLLGAREPIADYPEDVWDDVFRVNATGPFLVIKAALRSAMLEQKGGIIVNISSGVGRVGKANWGAYAASKFALEGLTQVLAQELAPSGIICVAINPEATRTAMRAEAYPLEDPLTLKTPEDFAQALVSFVEKISLSDSGRSFDYKDLKGR
ncbi:MAG: SDR family NAD(P)-dependent oxidoreductase [Elusimicrobiota bacterium]